MEAAFITRALAASTVPMLMLERWAMDSMLRRGLLRPSELIMTACAGAGAEGIGKHKGGA